MITDWLKKAPTSVVVTVIIMCGVVVLATLGTYLALAMSGADTTEFRQWVNTLGQVLVYPFLGVTAVASVSAARSASRAEDQTNGHLTHKEEEITELRRQLASARKASPSETSTFNQTR